MIERAHDRSNAVDNRVSRPRAFRDRSPPLTLAHELPGAPLDARRRCSGRHPAGKRGSLPSRNGSTCLDRALRPEALDEDVLHGVLDLAQEGEPSQRAASAARATGT
jgi:hypothetical protein